MLKSNAKSKKLSAKGIGALAIIVTTTVLSTGDLMPEESRGSLAAETVERCAIYFMGDSTKSAAPAPKALQFGVVEVNISGHPHIDSDESLMPAAAVTYAETNYIGLSRAVGADDQMYNRIFRVYLDTSTNVLIAIRSDTVRNSAPLVSEIQHKDWSVLRSLAYGRKEARRDSILPKVSFLEAVAKEPSVFAAQYIVGYLTSVCDTISDEQNQQWEIIGYGAPAIKGKDIYRFVIDANTGIGISSAFLGK